MALFQRLPAICSWEDSKSGRQVELKDPTAPWSLQRPNDIELAHRKPTEVNPKGYAGARDAVACAAEHRGPLSAVPRDPGIGKEGYLDRQWTVHPPRGTEWPEQGEPKLSVPDEQATSKEPIKCRTLTRGAWHTFGDIEGVHVIATN